jgi:gamma-polyglutamate biosynthesis protein CapA
MGDSMSVELLVAAVGDISTGDHPVCVGHGMRHAFSTYQHRVLDSVAPVLKQADITMANLETVTSNRGLKKYWLPSYEMRGDPQTLPILKAAGIDVVGVANNHAMQHGEAAFLDMLQEIQRAGLEFIGVDDEYGQTHAFEFEFGGAKHTVFAVSQRPEEWHKGKVPYSLRLDINSLIEEVVELRKSCEGFLICSIHWGLEFLNLPGPEQVATGRRLIDAGVDVVFGHHSHLLQPVERYKQGLIFYSLGNFAFDLWQADMKLSAVVKVHLRRGVRPEYTVTPVVIGDDFCLRLANDVESPKIHELAKELSGEAVEEILRKPYLDYRREYESARRAAKPLKYRYFARNVSRYPINFFAQSLGRTLLRRLTGT